MTAPIHPQAGARLSNALETLFNMHRLALVARLHLDEAGIQSGASLRPHFAGLGRRHLFVAEQLQAEVEELVAGGAR